MEGSDGCTDNSPKLSAFKFNSFSPGNMIEVTMGILMGNKHRIVKKNKNKKVFLLVVVRFQDLFIIVMWKKYLL